MKEEWKEIKEFQKYQVSNFGNVLGIKNRKLKLIKHKGYYTVSLSKNGVFKQKYVHRLVLETFKEKPEGKYECNHIDGNKLNNHIENLEWLTRIENMQHAIKLGLWNPSGYRNPNKTPFKLSDSDIKRIIKLRKNKVKIKTIAKFFGVSEATICNAARGKRSYYRHFTINE